VSQDSLDGRFSKILKTDGRRRPKNLGAIFFFLNGGGGKLPKLTLVLWWSTVVTKMVDHIFENLITISDFGYGFLRFFEVGRQQQKISLRPSLECHHDFSGINPNLFQTEKT